MAVDAAIKILNSELSDVHELVAKRKLGVEQAQSELSRQRAVLQRLKDKRAQIVEALADLRD